MLGTGRVLNFAFRALVLLLPVPLVWIAVADHYNQALVVAADVFVTEPVSLQARGTDILIQHSSFSSPVAIEAFMLHYGLVLQAVLILAAVGIGALPRVAGLAGMGAGAYVLHVAGLAMLARGVAWSSASATPEGSGTLVFSLFAVFWGLLPAVTAGAWAYFYWLPRAATSPHDGNPDQAEPSAPQEAQRGTEGPDTISARE